MNTITVTLNDKTMDTELTAAAHRALARLTAPLMVEIHLIFGCMIVKRVRFKEEVTSDAVPLAGNLRVRFRAVRYMKSCRLSDIDSDENPGDFPLAAEKRLFVPDVLSIDYRDGAWVGDFTYDRHRHAPL